MELLLVIIMLTMCCSIIYLMSAVYLGLNSNKWPCTSGVIIESKIRNARFVSIKIKYEYIVNGNKYVGKRIGFINPVYNTMNDLEADAIYNKLNKENLDVFYFGSYPRISTLKTGFSGWFITLVLVCINVIGLFWLSSIIRLSE